MIKMKTDQIEQPTLIRLQVLATQNENADDVINRLINIAMGADCPHDDLGIYMETILDARGFMDLTKTLDVLTDLRFGRPTTALIRVCKRCMHGMKIKL